MPIIDPVNTQQVLQMGPQAEKLQQAVQNQPLLTAQQLEEDRLKAEEQKRTEIQDPDEMSSSTETDSNKRRRRKLKRKEEAENDESKTPPPESSTGQRLNVSV